MPPQRCHRRELKALVADLAMLAGVDPSPECATLVADLLENAIADLARTADRLREHGRRLTLGPIHVSRAIRDLPVRIIGSPWLSAVCHLSGVVEQDLIDLVQPHPVATSSRPVRARDESSSQDAESQRRAVRGEPAPPRIVRVKQTVARRWAQSPEPSPSPSPSPSPAPQAATPAPEAAPRRFRVKRPNGGQGGSG